MAFVFARTNSSDNIVAVTDVLLFVDCSLTTHSHKYTNTIHTCMHVCMEYVMYKEEHPKLVQLSFSSFVQMQLLTYLLRFSSFRFPFPSIYDLCK